jgi:hypothetical protein
MAAFSQDFSQGSQGGGRGGGGSQPRVRNKTEFFECRYIIKDVDYGQWRQLKAPYQLCISESKKAIMVRPVISKDDANTSAKNDIIAFSEAWAANTHGPAIFSTVGLKKIKISFDLPKVEEEEIVSRVFVISFETAEIQPRVVALLISIGFRQLESASGGSTAGSVASIGRKTLLPSSVIAGQTPPPPAIIAASASTPLPATPIVLPSHITTPHSASSVLKTTYLAVTSSSSAIIPTNTPPVQVIPFFPSATTTRTQNADGVSLVNQATQDGTAPIPENQHLQPQLIETHCECKCGKAGCRISGNIDPTITSQPLQLPHPQSKSDEMSSSSTSLDDIYSDLLGTDDLASICNVLFGDWESLSRLAHRLGGIQSTSADAIQDMKE